MKKLNLEILEDVNGGGFCSAVAVADGVVAVGSYAAYAGWLALTPVGVGVLAGAGVVLAGISIGCAFT